MSIELSKEARAQAIASIERYFNEHKEERIGNIAAGAPHPIVGRASGVAQRRIEPARRDGGIEAQVDALGLAGQGLGEGGRGVTVARLR